MKTLSQKLIENEQNHLFEMGNFRKSKTKLPVNIWIDNQGSSTKHSPHRIKFQINTVDKIQKENFAVMTLDDDPIIIFNGKKTPLSKWKGKSIDKEIINAVNAWRKENNEFLKTIIDNEIKNDEISFSDDGKIDVPEKYKESTKTSGGEVVVKAHERDGHHVDEFTRKLPEK